MAIPCKPDFAIGSVSCIRISPSTVSTRAEHDADFCGGAGGMAHGRPFARPLCCADRGGSVAGDGTVVVAAHVRGVQTLDEVGTGGQAHNVESRIWEAV